MKVIRIESRQQWENYKKRVREACAKANAEMSQDELLEMLGKMEEAKSTIEGDRGYLRRLLEQQAVEEKEKKKDE